MAGRVCACFQLRQACIFPAGLTVNDVDIFEINEAFASQVSLVSCCWLGLGSMGEGSSQDWRQEGHRCQLLLWLLAGCLLCGEAGHPP